MDEPLSDDSLRILQALPPDGTSLGNLRLRERVGLAADGYVRGAAHLKAVGLVVAGRGRGGSLALSATGKVLRATLQSLTDLPDIPPVVPEQPAMKPEPSTRTRRANGAEPLGFEATLWKTADKLRGSMDASEYKHMVLGLVFLKYVDDAFAGRRGHGGGGGRMTNMGRSGTWRRQG